MAAHRLQVDHDASTTALNGAFTTGVVRITLRRMAKHKASGGDNVPTEVLKDAGESGTRLLC